MIISLIGGIGLFLLGMILLTDGLKSFAGDSLRKALLRFTNKPVTAFTSGALATAVVQSSSATTLATIGFVSAGLLSFNQSIGIVMGASLGTTSTGWLVSLFGLKLSIAQFALPLIGIGAFLRLLGKGRWPMLGLALAGFGLIFVGIDQLQLGMAGLNQHIDFSRIPSTGLFGHLLMILIGILLTVVMQSSSAAVATTLTALHASTLTFEQAASVVIGAAIGTTVTAALATIGATAVAQRTALAHILFNLFTGIIAWILLPLFMLVIRWADLHLGLPPGAVSLAAFHTLFIAVGVILVLPFIEPFGRFIERIRPDHGPALTRMLDRSLLEVPSIAMETLRSCLRECSTELLTLLEQRLRNIPPDPALVASSEQIGRALEEARTFLATIPAVEHQETGANVRLDSLHAIDHLFQLLPSATQNFGSIAQPPLSQGAEQALTLVQEIRAGLKPTATQSADEPSLPKITPETLSTRLAEWRRTERLQLLSETSLGKLSPEDSLRVLDQLRWIDQIGYHTWRIFVHLRPNEEPKPAPSKQPK